MMRSSLKSIPLCIALAALLVATANATRSYATTFADRLPARTIALVEFAGTDALAPAYANSHLQGFAQDADLKTLYQSIIDAASTRVGGAAEQRTAFRAAIKNTEETARYPIAFTLLNLDSDKHGNPTGFALLIDAGKDAPDLEKKLVTSLDKPLHDPVLNVRPQGAIQTYEHGYINLKRYPTGVIAITSKTMPEAIDAALTGPAHQDSLLNSPEYRAALAQSAPSNNGVLAVHAYINAAEILAQLKKQLNDAAPADDKARDLTKAQAQATYAYSYLTKSKISGLTQLSYSAAFDQQSWQEISYAGMGQDRTAALQLLNTPPLDQSQLAQVPRNARAFFATRYDISALLNSFIDAADEVDGTSRRDYRRQVADFKQQFGLDLEKDLLSTLGDQWLLIRGGTSTGLLGLQNITFINTLKDPAHLERALADFDHAANQKLSDSASKMEIKTTTENGVTIHYLALTAGTAQPAWAVANGRLYISATPRLVSRAIQQSASTTSILDNSDYQAAFKKLGIDRNAVSIAYNDLRQTVPLTLSAMQLAIAALRVAGQADLPMGVIPPTEKILPDLAPKASISWVDDAGWHSKTNSPFPGSGLLGGDISPASLVIPSLFSYLSVPVPVPPPATAPLHQP